MCAMLLRCAVLRRRKGPDFGGGHAAGMGALCVCVCVCVCVKMEDIDSMSDGKKTEDIDSISDGKKTEDIDSTCVKTEDIDYMTAVPRQVVRMPE